MVVGITGGIGSGKSLVAKAFCSFQNTVYYHADEEAKNLMNTSASIQQEIILEFGKKSYQDNQLNRTYISSMVFKNPELLKKLNSIVHPAVKAHFKNFINSYNPNTLIIYENAILFETGSDLVCDVVISVCAPLKERIKRVVERDHINEEKVIDRIMNQWPDSMRNLLSNYLVINIDKKETLLKIKNIYNILTKNLTFF
ncbi:MAG: dephospho-CoA kinase [Flavobacteriaceae bacterium]|jgi:dephospho-CoA kinase